MANPWHDKPQDMTRPEMQQGDQKRRPEEQFPSSGSGARRPDASQDPGASQDNRQRPSERSDREQAERDSNDDQAQAAGGRSSKSSSRSASESSSKSSASKAGKSSMNRDDSSSSKSSQRK